MWTLETIVEAVRNGETFLIPFHFNLSEPNGYYILGQQYICTGVAVGPEHTPDIEVTPEDTLSMTLWFPKGMVPNRAFYQPINKQGVGPVHAFIMKEDINWDLLNGGQQIKVRGGWRQLLRNPKEKLKYCGQCNQLRQTLEGERCWQQMIYLREPISMEEFEAACEIETLMDEDETLEDFIIGDSEAGFYKSLWGNQPCIFIQSSGFEFIFI